MTAGRARTRSKAKPVGKTAKPAEAAQRPSSAPPAMDYAPTEEERAILARYAKRRPSPRITAKVGNNGAAVIGVDHPDVTMGYVSLAEAIGTTDMDFLRGMMNQLTNAGSAGSKSANEDGINFMLSVVKGISPTDQIEAMLAAQMAAVHMATMTFARRLGSVENIPQQDSASSAFNRFTRTFALQMEALSRYRGKGQRMVVEHVHVHSGGQAIVGPINSQRGAGEPAAGGGKTEISDKQPHALSAEMRSPNAERIGLPGASGEGAKAVSHARRS